MSRSKTAEGCVPTCLAPSHGQAFDRKSQKPGDEALACALYAELMDRNGGGAFDVLRTYGNLSALQRNMLGWRGGQAG